MTNFELIKTMSLENCIALFGEYSLCRYVRMSDGFRGCADFDDCEECLKKFLKANVDDFVEETVKDESNVELLAGHPFENDIVVPSCKVGDTVYQLDSAGNIYKSEVTQVIYNTKGIAFDGRAIGKFVFLTREEAEKAFAERECKDDQA